MNAAAHKRIVDGSPRTERPPKGISGAFDEKVFNRFVADLGSEAIVLEFLLTFEAMLDARIDRISQALKGQDREETKTAMMSLQTSAAMAGASTLEATIGRALAHHPVELTPRGPLVRQLQGEADFFRQALTDFRRRRITSVT